MRDQLQQLFPSIPIWNQYTKEMATIASSPCRQWAENATLGKDWYHIFLASVESHLLSDALTYLQEMNCPNQSECNLPKAKGRLSVEGRPIIFSAVEASD